MKDRDWFMEQLSKTTSVGWMDAFQIHRALEEEMIINASVAFCVFSIRKHFYLLAPTYADQLAYSASAHTTKEFTLIYVRNLLHE